ncbi:MAG TPA: hypothetical protein VI548_11495 [Chitinophagaceae bacterium]|nr:hypothetical protein [Chitinophagaceae bacterium]
MEAEVNALSNEKADLEKLIHEFGVRHNNELGELIIKILRFRKQKAKGTPFSNSSSSGYLLLKCISNFVISEPGFTYHSFGK